MSFFSLLKRIFTYEKYTTELIAHRVGEIEVYLDANYHPAPKPEPKAVSVAEAEPAASSKQASSRAEARYSIESAEEGKARSTVRYSITCNRTPTRGVIHESLLTNHLDEIMGRNRGGDVLKAVGSAPLQTFVEYLRHHIYRQGLTGPQVYRAAQIDKRLYSKIISNTYYSPSRETAIALAFAARLPLHDAKTMLSRAGYTLSETNRRDLILTYFFQNKSWNLIEINAVLDALGEAPVGRG